MITIYDVFDVKITLEVIENGRTRCEKNQVSYEKKHCYVAINLHRIAGTCKQKCERDYYV